MLVKTDQRGWFGEDGKSWKIGYGGHDVVTNRHFLEYRYSGQFGLSEEFVQVVYLESDGNYTLQSEYREFLEDGELEALSDSGLFSEDWSGRLKMVSLGDMEEMVKLEWLMRMEAAGMMGNLVKRERDECLVNLGISES